MNILVQVLNYNGSVYTGSLFMECLQSLYRQSYRDMSITVIDNDSTDNSVHMILEKFPETQIIKLKSNMATIAFNEGFQAFLNSDADILLICNNDMVFDDDFIRNAVEMIKKRPDGGLFTPHIMLMNGRINSTGIVINRSGYAWDRDYNRLHSARNAGEVLAASGGAMFIRREIAQRHICFDPIYNAYYEDVDMSMSVRMGTEYKIYYMPEARVMHAFSQSWSSRGRSKDYFMMRNRYIFVLKFFPLRMLVNALRYLFFTSGTGDRTLDRRVYRDLIKCMPHILKRRIYVMMHYRKFPVHMLEQYQGIPRITKM